MRSAHIILIVSCRVQIPAHSFRIKMIPQIIKDALLHDDYEKKPGFSATTLIMPPQMRILEERYGADEKDIYSQFYSKLGTAWHNYLEDYVLKHGDDTMSVEEKMFREVLSRNGTIDTKVNGTRDLSIGDYQFDHKLTSVWKYVKKDFDDWIAQQNIYHWLDDRRPKNLINIAYFRDWSAKKKLSTRGYPEKHIVPIPIEIWGRDKQERYIKDRIDFHISSESLPDDKLPECSEKERWYKGTKYAVMKRGRKSAVRLLNSLEEANEYAKGVKGQTYIEIRKGENTRCEEHCPVKSKCKQYWRLLQ